MVQTAYMWQRDGIPDKFTVRIPYSHANYASRHVEG
jgi:hypothetical protein